VAAARFTPDAALFTRAVKRWRADGVVTMVAEDVMALPSGTTIDPRQSLFEEIARAWGEPAAWEIAVPGAVNIDTATARWLERSPGDAALTMELTGVTVSGRRVFHAREHHVPGIVRYGFVRTIR
jgi:DNA-binding GntR family transcriptional regulator